MMWAMIDQAIMSGARFLTAVMVGRFGSDEELGLYSLGFGLLVLIVGVHEAFVTTPYTVFLPRKEQEDHGAYQGFALRTTLQLSAVLSTLLLFAALMARLLPTVPGLLSVIVAVACALPLVLLREFARRLQFAHSRTGMACVLDGLVAVVQLGGLALLMTQRPLSAITAFVLTAVACAVSTAIWWALERSEISHDVTNQKQDYIEHAKFGRWIFGENMVSVVQMYFGHWYLTLTHDSATSTGIFAACISVVMLINPFLLAVTSIMTPRVARVYSSGSRIAVATATWKYVAFVVAIMGLFSIAMWGFGGWIAVLFFGKLGEGRSFEVGLLGTMMIAQGANYTLSVGLRILDRPHWNLATAIFGTSLTVVIAFLFTSHDITGVVVSLFTGVLAITVVRVISFIKLTSGHEGVRRELSGAALLDGQES
jgi:O-antigen/teichoic acid export membrane protein